MSKIVELYGVPTDADADWPAVVAAQQCPLVHGTIRANGRREEREQMVGLVEGWRDEATASREEAARIRRTFKKSTGAEERCNVRAEVWDNCADELEQELERLAAGEGE